MPIHRRYHLQLIGGVSLFVGLLSGCASIPTSGPTAGQIVKGAIRNDILDMQVIDLDATAISNTGRNEAIADSKIATLASLTAIGRNDLVGPGDVLSISLYEVGVGLFSGSQIGSVNPLDPSSRGETFPAVVVDHDGAIRLPYTSTMHVAGKTVSEIEDMIAKAYVGKSQSPQASVAIKQNLSQTVYVTGDVRKPGRIDLTLQNERLLDAIANAGGGVSQTQDMVIRFARDGHIVEERLDRIQAGAPDDLVMISGDRIELIREPQTFVVLGAANKAAQVPFDQTDLTLAEAIARAGGPNDANANPKSVFLFRYEPSTIADAAPKPVIYRINLMQPASYFLAQKFAMRNKDVVYVSSAAINRLGKLVAIINQLVSPAVTAKVLSGN